MKKINRRNFIDQAITKTGSLVLAPSVIGAGGIVLSNFLTSCSAPNPEQSLSQASSESFPMLEVKGSYYDIGYAIGKNFEHQIKDYLTTRKEWFGELKDLSSGRGKELFKGLKNKANQHYPHFVEELRGLALGAEISFNDIFLLNIKDEMGTLLNNIAQETPGCSTVVLNNDKRKYIIHNEDGDKANVDNMYIVKATPPSGVAFTVLTYPGIIMGNGPGFNDRGIAQSTNYIASKTFKTGIPRYFMGRAVLEAKTLSEATDIVTDTNRAFAYHHNLASFSENKILSIEVTPDIHQIIAPHGIFYHTNHLIHFETKYHPQDENYINSSSLPRYTAISNRLNHFKDIFKINRNDVMQIMSDHTNKPYSVCRHPKGDVHGITLGTAVIDILGGTMDIYKGNPCTSYKNDLFSSYSFDQPKG